MGGFALAFEWSVSGSCRQAGRSAHKGTAWRDCRTSLKRSTRMRPQGTTRITLTAAQPWWGSEKRKGHRESRQPRDITGNVQLYKPWRELALASVGGALSWIWGWGQGICSSAEPYDQSDISRSPSFRTIDQRENPDFSYLSTSEFTSRSVAIWRKIGLGTDEKLFFA